MKKITKSNKSNLIYWIAGVVAVIVLFYLISGSINISVKDSKTGELRKESLRGVLFSYGWGGAGGPSGPQSSSSSSTGGGIDGGDDETGSSSSSSSSTGSSSGGGDVTELTAFELSYLTAKDDKYLDYCTKNLPCTISENHGLYNKYCKQKGKKMGYMVYGSKELTVKPLRCKNEGPCCNFRAPVRNDYSDDKIFACTMDTLKCGMCPIINDEKLECSTKNDVYQCRMKDSCGPANDPAYDRVYFDTDGDCMFDKYIQKSKCADGVERFTECSNFKISAEEIKRGGAEIKGRRCEYKVGGVTVSINEDKNNDGTIDDSEVGNLEALNRETEKCQGFKCKHFEGANGKTVIICEAKECSSLDYPNIKGPCTITNDGDREKIEYTDENGNPIIEVSYTDENGNEISKVTVKDKNGNDITITYQEVDGKFVQIDPPPSTTLSISVQELEEFKKQIEWNAENRRRANAAATRCFICLSLHTKISTPNGKINVEELKEGMLVWTLDKDGKKVAQPILKVSSTLVPRNHQVVHLVLEDGRELFVSPGHPAADGRTVKDLKIGEIYDNSFVKSINLEFYNYDRTYDLLPSGETGYYFANNILMGSTMKN